MSSIRDEICQEIKSLRKGAGLSSTTRNDRLGPNLRKLAGVTGAGTRVDWNLLQRKLVAYAKRLDEETCMHALVGLNLWPAATGEPPDFGRRLEWLGKLTHVGERTARRRVDEAHERLAVEIERDLDDAGKRGAGWVLREFNSRVRLDQPLPVAHETRTIVATRGGLRQIKAWWDFPAAGGPAPEVTLDVSYGAQLVRQDNPREGGRTLFIRLPQPLEQGEEYEFGIDVTVAERSAMRPHYIFTPEIVCDVFNLRLRFGERPKWISEVRGQTVRSFDSAQPVDGMLELDGAREVNLTFPEPQCFLGYGARWQF